jgi:hypothetical protein
VASNLITTSVDSWFNIRVEDSLDKALSWRRPTPRNPARTLTQARQVRAAGGAHV